MNIAVIIPCYNEEQAISTVVKDAKKHLPSAKIYVCDNNSTDNTAKVAKQAGAEVIFETHKGKGHAIRRLFNEVDADIYIMVDGDATYDLSAAPTLAKKMVSEKLDMIIGQRVSEEETAYRPAHRFGNLLFTTALGVIFGQKFTDVLSGYRVFSKRFVKSFPFAGGGFEAESQLTIHSLQLKLPTAEVATKYFSRPEGSVSKLSTWKDGFKILIKIIQLFESEKPLSFFGIIAGIFGVASLCLGLPLIIDYMSSGLVPRLPTAILVMGLMILAFITLLTGIILHSIAHTRREQKLLAYLNS